MTERPFSTDMVLRPAPHLRFVLVDADCTMAVGERQRYAIRGKAANLIVKLVDGRRTYNDVLTQAGALVGEEAAVVALEGLLDARLIQPQLTNQGEAKPYQAFDSMLGSASDTANLTVSIAWQTAQLAGELGGRMVRALASAGLQVAEDGAVLVLVADNYLTISQPDKNHAPRPWVLIQPKGGRPLIGPLFIAAQSPCLECLQYALRRQRPLEQMLRARALASEFPDCGLAASADAVCNLLAASLRDLLLRDVSQIDSHPLHQTVLAYDLQTMQLCHHRVQQRPQCAICGDARTMATAGFSAPALSLTKPVVMRDGGFRQQDASHTYARLRHLVSDLLGPVNHLTERRNQADEMLPVFYSGFMRMPQQEAEITIQGNPFDRVCAGKGLTRDQARMSALGEATERCASLFQGDEATVRASLEFLSNLSADAKRDLLSGYPLDSLHLPWRVLSPQSLLLFSARQREREESEARSVPRTLDDHSVIGWTPAFAVDRSHVGWLPTSYVFADTPRDLGAPYCVYSSNGSAAGSSLVEAALQGLFELIERDAVAIWWYNRVRRPELQLSDVALSTAQRQRLESFRRTLLAQGFESWLLDLTHDLRTPVVVAVARHAQTGRLAFGFGCHHDLGLTVCRAYSELSQLCDLSNARPAPWDAIAREDCRFLYPCPEAQRIPHQEHAAQESEDASVLLSRYADMLAQHGLSVYVVNKSRPDLPLAVAQVVVPGLRHVWPRLAPGRLYDVPVNLGFQPRALQEHELNPVPLLV